ncbi:MAG: Inositol 2-dehydrogenase/D-chiro-inositol 3-dehydrogenase [Fimbriimonadaceae bacterium]|nr:Inositol 2-dehydrogenase/D-chiro-inositol 3-dehydrogenase [Fimbriimonadaceae bacterium]
MSQRTLNVGLIGYQFMGKAHSNAYRQANRFFDLPYQIGMKTICGRNAEAVAKAAQTFGWDQSETDWRRVVEDPAIDIIDVSTPGDTHCEIACAAAEAGKIVFCEKPIGNTLQEAQRMVDAVRKSGRPHAIFHNYRKAPAVGLAKRMIEDGRIGRIFHWRAVYLQDWIVDPQFPLVWRLQKERAGSGAHGDINAHIIDLARYLVGEIQSVSGMMHTFIEKRPLPGAIDDRLGATAGQEMGEVTVDDAAMFLARFHGGPIGTFEASRFATGRKNYNSFEINGSEGSVIFNLERMNELQYYSRHDDADAQGFRLIQATEGSQPYAGHYWPPGHIIGYEHTFVNLVADALVAIDKGEMPSPNMEDGYRNQVVLDGVERSANSSSWVNLSY